MTKDEILQIINREYLKTKHPYWLQVKGKVIKSHGVMVLTGLTRYIEASEKHKTRIEASCFVEILDDAKLNQFIWLVANDDTAQIQGLKYTKGLSAKSRDKILAGRLNRMARALKQSFSPTV